MVARSVPKSAAAVTLTSRHHPRPRVRNFLWFHGHRVLACCVFVCFVESTYCIFAIDWVSTLMIVVEESQVRKSQPNHDPNVAAATSSTPLIPPSESPPAYTPREDPGPSSLSAPPYYNSHLPPVTQKRQPKRAVERFVGALLLAFAAYAAIVSVVKLISIVIDGPPHDVRWTRRSSQSFVTFEDLSEEVLSESSPTERPDTPSPKTGESSVASGAGMVHGHRPLVFSFRHSVFH